MAALNELLILGCGHSEADTLFNNNALVRTEQGNLLLDCGYTIKPALFAQGLGLEDIDAVVITHVHADHVFGLERLANEGRYKFKRKVRLYLHPSLYDELWHQTLKGSLGRNGEGECTLEDYFELCLIENNEFHYAGNHYRLHTVSHTPLKPCFGIEINQSLFYSGDTLAVPALLAELKPKLVFHDCTLASWNPVHAPIASLQALYSKELRARMYLMSYEDHWADFSRLADEEFAGFAWQGQRIDLTELKLVVFNQGEAQPVASSACAQRANAKGQC